MIKRFQIPNSKCIWDFDYINDKLVIRVNTQNHIIYSEYAFYGTLEISVGYNNPVYLETKSKPSLSLDKKVYYYKGKIKWEANLPMYFSEGILAFKESNEFGHSYKMVYIDFALNPNGWEIQKVFNPLFDVNELLIPPI